jgi:hypothetical protein
VADHAILSKIATAGFYAHNCKSNYVPTELPHGNSVALVLKLPLAQGIVAESPQEAHRRFRGLEVESPVFCGYAAKNAPKIIRVFRDPIWSMAGGR